MRGKNILVTGGTGFVGSALIAKLLREGANVLALCRPGNGDQISRVDKALLSIRPFLTRRGSLEVIYGDVTVPGVLSDPQDVERWRGKIDQIWHAAGSIDFNAVEENEKINVCGSQNMAQLAIDLGVQRMLYVSTAFVAGSNTGLIREDDPEPTSYNNSYEESKVRGERILQNALGDKLVIVRPTIVVGAMSHEEYDDWGRSTPTTFAAYYGFFLAFHLMKKMLAPDDFLDLGPTRIAGNPEARINIIPVNFLAKICFALMSTEKTAGQIFHAAHPAPPNYLSLVRRTLRIMGIVGGQIGVELTGEVTSIEEKIAKGTEVFRPYVDSDRAFSMEKIRPYFNPKEIPQIDDELGVREIMLPAMAADFKGLNFKKKKRTQ